MSTIIFPELPVGRENAISKEELMNICGFKDDRAFLKEKSYEINELQYPILNYGNKYFRSDDPEDYKPCVRKLLRTGWNTVKTGRALYSLIPDTSGQLTFEEYMEQCAAEFGNQ